MRSLSLLRQPRQPLRWAALLLPSLVVATVACSTGGPLELPSWMEPAARWRAEPSIDTTRLDAAVSRHARSYRDRYGAAHYREFGVLPPRALPDVTAAIDTALARAGHAAATRVEIAGALEAEREVRWTTRNKKAIVMVYLTHAGSASNGEPAFVILFEPK